MDGATPPPEDPANSAEKEGPNVTIKNGEARVDTSDPKDASGGDEKLFAGKYKSVEELEKGYAELQSAYSSKSPPDSESSKGSEGDDDNSLIIQPKSDGDTPSAEALIAQSMQEGEEMPLAKLKKMGITEQTANLIKEGIEAESSKFRSELYRVTEGKENYAEISEWAKDNVDQDELDAYNKAVTTGDVATSRLLLRGLRAAFEAGEGPVDPKRVTGAQIPRQSGAESYNSQAEWIADINNPRYDEDPAFRAEVMERVKVSPNL